MFSVARSAALVASALLALTTAGCGGSATGDAPAATARTITDARGQQVAVPSRATRVLPLSEPTLDAALALGITPIATTTGRGQNAIPSYLKARAKGIASVGSLGAPNLEQVAQVAPDLILLDGTAFQDAAVIDKLRKIAPTVFVSQDGTDWRAAFETTADVLGRAEEGNEVLARYDERIKGVRAGLGARATDSVSIVRWSGIGLPAILMKELTAGRVLTDLGLPRPDFQDQTGPGHTVPVSLEQLEDLDADWMFFGALGGGGADAGSVDLPADVASAQEAIKTAEETPGFTRLKAFKAGHVVPVDGSAWTSAGGPIAAGVVVDDVERALGS